MNWYSQTKISAQPWPPHEPFGQDFQPWTKNPRDLAKSLLFHGTGEPIEGQLREGGDGLFWTAETPDIAQNYIPESGMTMSFGGWQLKSHPEETFPPNKGFNYNLLLEMGCDPKKLEQTTWDHTGRAQSYYSCKTNQEVMDFLKTKYGYEMDENNRYSLKMGFEGDREVLYPKNYSAKGTLFMLLGKEKLKIYDMTEGGKKDGDLMDSDYKKYDEFEKLQAAGYDGVRINDFAQSKMYGNFGHRSIGIFPQGLKKLQVAHIKETPNYDWPHPIPQTPNRWLTPEYLAWHKQQVQEAINAGKPVPPEIRKEHGL